MRSSTAFRCSSSTALKVPPPSSLMSVTRHTSHVTRHTSHVTRPKHSNFHIAHPPHLMPSFSSISSYCGSSEASPDLCPFSALSRWLYLRKQARWRGRWVQQALCVRMYFVAFFRRASLMRLRSSAANTCENRHNLPLHPHHKRVQIWVSQCSPAHPRPRSTHADHLHLHSASCRMRVAHVT